ncbi:MAG: hypothetical protein CM1200mP30_22000 [Pseudomonadota bacterium]|nr:MAG: hypothetical protein CM1200mP30_22000 [Pseudomonadota bacterium]
MNDFMIHFSKFYKMISQKGGFIKIKNSITFKLAYRQQQLHGETDAVWNPSRRLIVHGAAVVPHQTSPWHQLWR